MEYCVADWQVAMAIGPDTAGTVHWKVTKLFIKKYGWHFNHEDDVPDGIPDPPDSSLLDPEPSINKDESKAHHEYYTATCKVSNATVI